MRKTGARRKGEGRKERRKGRKEESKEERGIRKEERDRRKAGRKEQKKGRKEGKKEGTYEKTEEREIPEVVGGVQGALVVIYVQPCRSRHGSSSSTTAAALHGGNNHAEFQQFSDSVIAGVRQLQLVMSRRIRAVKVFAPQIVRLEPKLGAGDLELLDAFLGIDGVQQGVGALAAQRVVRDDQRVQFVVEAQSVGQYHGRFGAEAVLRQIEVLDAVVDGHRLGDGATPELP